MNSLYTLLTGKYIEGVTDLDRLITPAVLQIFRKKMKDYVQDFNCPDLTEEEKRRIKEYFKRYSKVDYLYHRGYKARSGKFYVDYMPDDIYFGRVEPYFTDRLYSKYLDNKCLYYSFFSNVRQPGMIAMRIGNEWVDETFSMISTDRVIELVDAKDSCVIKKATESEGGYGVVFLEGDDKISSLKKVITSNKTDLVIQDTIRQHPAYSRLNESSVNTLRIMSLLTKDGVKILAGAVRIGTKGGRVDNLSNGGVFCGIDNNGQMTDIGLLDDGSVIKRHPDHGYLFADIVLPHYDKAVQLIKDAHGIMGHNKIASWDIAIDDTGEAVLVETNLALGTIFSMQVCCGPLFGKDTKKILEEVYFHKNGKRREVPYFGLNARDYYYIRDNVFAILFRSYKTGFTRTSLLSNKALRMIGRKHAKQETQKKLHGNIRLCDIDGYLSDKDLAYYLDNKCFYRRLFPFAKQPETLAMRIGGIWMDADYRPVSVGKVKDILFAEKEIMIRAAARYESKSNEYKVSFDGIKDNREKAHLLSVDVKKIKGDIIIQKTIKQNDELSALNRGAFNIIRIYSLIIENKVVILKRALHLGIYMDKDDGKFAERSFCGIDENGCLDGTGAVTGYMLKGKKIPFLDKCEEMVKKAHPVIGHNRIAYWDIVVDDKGNEILTDVNLSPLTSKILRGTAGSFFGKYTKKVIEEAYGNK
ncbi:MAG: hypothetical protein K6G03_03725 [Lachnospiraceae bacterium]|nr:hypothetical protein [Lachnospiraceae bacterium]